MVKEMSVHTVPTNKKARTVVSGLFASALILLVVSAILDKYKGLFGMAILAVLTAAILFYTRYIAAKYIYDLTTSEDGCPILIARSITGKRQTTLMRIDLCTVDSVERLDADQIKAYRIDSGILKYVYSPTFKPDSLILIRSRSRYEKADVFIEAPKEFEELIRENSEYAKSIYSDDDQ